MVEHNTNTIADVARQAGTYPEPAYHFVREGLGHAAETVHGPLTPELLSITKFLAENEIDLTELVERLARGEVDPALAQAIEAVGGCDKLNRHVSGQELCWALRDLALKRWGPLAEVVLRSWMVRETLDFGKIVFTLIDHHWLQRQPDDSLDDFKQVYSFRDAFAAPLRLEADDAGDD